MQSRGFFAARRSTDENSRGNVTNVTHRSNGDVIRNDYRFSDSRLAERAEAREENQHRYGRIGRSRRLERPAYPKDVYPEDVLCPEERGAASNYADRDLETTQSRQRVRQRDYTVSAYEDSWRSVVSSDLNGLGSKPTLRNGISHGRGERLYSSTLPRRSRTINFRDQPSSSLESWRGYLRSLQDLSDLELDDRPRDLADSSFLSSNRDDWRSDRLLVAAQDDGYRRRRYRENRLEDDYLRLYRSLSRLSKYPQGGKYEPGQVHYERECRTFGKDTVAFIYYKTCYLWCTRVRDNVDDDSGSSKDRHPSGMLCDSSTTSKIGHLISAMFVLPMQFCDWLTRTGNFRGLFFAEFRMYSSVTIFSFKDESPWESLVRNRGRERETERGNDLVFVRARSH